MKIGEKLEVISKMIAVGTALAAVAHPMIEALKNMFQ